MIPEREIAGWVPVVQLFSRLLLRELDRETLTALQAPAVANALAALEVDLPSADDLEALQARYCALFLHPERGAPPVASLWVDGQYEGDSLQTLRKIAAAAGCDFDRSAAGGAAEDHLGSILLLWCACVESDPELARLLRSQHLGWAERALAQGARDEGFYGQVSRATLRLLADLA